MKEQIETNIYSKIPIIPVIQHNGEKRLVTLREFLINSIHYSDFCLSYCSERIAFNHFIILIGLAMCHKFNKFEFKNSEDFIENMVKYLDQYEQHFELAGPNYYFLQQNFNEKLMEKEIQSIAKLLPEVESGNNSNFFTKADDSSPRKYNLPEVFFALLQGHLIGYGGLGGGFKNDVYNFTDTFAAKPISIFIKKENLADSIFINVNINNIYNEKNEELKRIALTPIWECPDHGVEMLAKFKTLTGAEVYQKFGYERIIKIYWEYDSNNNQPYACFSKIAQGIKKDDDIEKYYLNVAITKTSKEEDIYLKPNQDKVLWRNLDNVLHRFSLIKKNSELTFLINETFELEALGLYSDKAKIFGSIRSLFKIPTDLIDEKNLNKLKKCIILVEKNQTYLYANFKDSLKKLPSNGEKEMAKEDIDAYLQHTSAFMEYWNFITLYFNSFFVFEKIVNNFEHFSEELEKKIREAKLRAADKFIQDFPHKSTKYKLMGMIYKGIHYVGTI
ncbi:type I-E CRISPR-associated protein Cse1/CasA [Silvanigrella aquatica]|uniref:Type I-E CRISPR-associated protein Cse1/CasA n=1 Tax=Silvanigrella aquatica TaxID=1915309 RepID=A0A1L4CXY9_9BACT|nr:type I-E CRISPR-associated protein Cse1/CasA [Silvanigrella aquatica]APJ02804.1 hypothetical protein AXG55_02230 [Silvanigrella aquatica]